MALNAEFKSLYRMLVSKKHLLEWVTAEEAEKSSKNDLKSYYLNMIPNLVAGLLATVIVLASDFTLVSNIIILSL